MKVKVTSAGITKKGSGNHLLSNTSYHLPTMRNIASDAPCITLPRIPTKPSPSSASGTVATTTTQNFVPASQLVNSGQHNSVKITNLVKETQPLVRAVISHASPSVTVPLLQRPPSTVPYRSSNKVVKTKVQTLTNASNKSKPATQAIRIAVQSKKFPSKQDSLPTSVVQANKITKPDAVPISAVQIKQISAKPKLTQSTTTQSAKSVTLKQDPIIVQSNNTVQTKQLVIEQDEIPTTPLKEVDQDQILPQISPSQSPSTKSPGPDAINEKTATKRKALTSSTKSSLSKTSGKFSCNSDNQIRVAKNNSKAKVPSNLRASSPSPRSDNASTPKPKKRHKTWKVVVSERHHSNHQNSLDPASTKSGSSKRQNSSSADTSKVNFKETALSPVAGEIKDLLHAFGDSCDPLRRSIQLVGTVLQHELGGFINICEFKASIRGTKTLGFTEAILALKGNIPRMNRMYKHFGFKDIYDRKFLLQAQALQKLGPKKLLYTKEIQRIIKDLNLVDLHHLLNIGLGDIESSLQGIEDSKLEEAVRSNPEMLKFYQYAKTRSLSFARKLSTVNIRKWIITNCHVHAKVTDTFVSVLDFLTLELVAELVDSAFGIRKERLVTCTETRVANPDTCMSAPFFLKKRKDDRCNQVSEILVQASEMEATRLKKEQKKNPERRRTETAASSPVIIYPGYIREAYMRIQADSCRPSSSFRVQASLIRPFL